jgi:hypothetical protein
MHILYSKSQYLPELHQKTSGLYYKTLRCSNLWEMDKFRSKLAPFGLDKHARLSKQTH